MTRTPQAGFTLLEILLALAIFAGASLSLMSSLNGQMQATSQIRELTLASWVADNYLVEQQLKMSTDGNADIAKSKTVLAGRSWSLESNITQRGDLNVQSVTVTLENGQKKTLERLWPEQAESKK